MDINDILTAVEQENLVGHPDFDSESYNALDSEVMKIGSLQHGDVNWDIVEKQSILYLQKICKDYKVLGHLVKCLLRDASVDKLYRCLTVFVKFNEDFLFLGYPAPDEKLIKGAKSKAIKLICSFFEDCLKSDRLQVTPAQFIEIEAQLTELSHQFKHHKSLRESVISLDKLAKRLQSQSTIIAQVEQPLVMGALNSIGDSNTASDMSTVENVSFNNHRETKSSYFKVAEHCNLHSPSDALGYRLRRYAIWQGISMLPPQNAEGVTQMTAVANDRIFDYREALNSAPNIELLKKIEKTLETSPFWIEGNFLAASCANLLGYHMVSEAIQQATIDFVSQIDTFKTAKFSNGSPFIPDDIAQWLQTEETTGLAEKSVVMQPYHSQADLTKCYEDKGLASVLQQIDIDYQMASDVREQFNYRLEKIHYLMQSEIYDLCKLELNEIREFAKQYTVLDWEASFFKKIDNMLRQMKNR